MENLKIANGNLTIKVSEEDENEISFTNLVELWEISIDYNYVYLTLDGELVGFDNLTPISYSYMTHKDEEYFVYELGKKGNNLNLLFNILANGYSSYKLKNEQPYLVEEYFEKYDFIYVDIWDGKQWLTQKITFAGLQLPSDVPINLDLKDLELDIIKVRLQMNQNSYNINSANYDYAKDHKKISRTALKPNKAILHPNSKQVSVKNLIMNDDSFYLIEETGDYTVIEFEPKINNQKNIYIVKIKGYYYNFN